MTSKIDINDIIKIAVQAGDAILKVYARDFEVVTKDDNSPLTEADKNSNDVIVEGLTNKYPNIPIISEETKAVEYSERKNWAAYWLVDPLDGTKEFIKKNGEFTVNIALIENGVPVLGVVYVPVQDTTYYGIEGVGAFKIDTTGKTEIGNTTHYSQKESLLVVASRSHLSKEVEEFVEKLRSEGKEVEFLSAGSSLKLCLVAEGKADVYPRFGPTMEWDTGAAHAVATAAGRSVLQADTMQDLKYNKENLLNPWFIVE